MQIIVQKMYGRIALYLVLEKERLLQFSFPEKGTQTELLSVPLLSHAVAPPASIFQL